MSAEFTERSTERLQTAQTDGASRRTPSALAMATTIPEVVALHARQRPDSPAVITWSAAECSTITYGQLSQHIAATQLWLKDWWPAAEGAAQGAQSARRGPGRHPQRIAFPLSEIFEGAIPPGGAPTRRRTHCARRSWGS